MPWSSTFPLLCPGAGGPGLSGKDLAMTLAQLRYFCTAAKYHSITKAAKDLNVTPPTISIAIRDLEKEFGISLFQHVGSKIAMTKEGEVFYQQVSAIIGSCDELQQEYASPLARRPKVKLGIPPLLSMVFFPRMVEAFHEVYPDTWLELSEYGSVRACELVQDEVLDIGLVNMELPGIDKFNTLEMIADPIMFCVSREHPMANRSKIRLEELDGEPIILLNRDSVYNQRLQNRFAALSLSPKIIMHSSQILTILNFVRGGKCGCFFYRMMLPSFPELVGIPLDPVLDTRIGLVWKRGRYLSGGMQEFLKFSRDYPVG